MKKFVLCLGLIVVCGNAFAETIKLKSGEVYEGTVVDRNDSYVTLETGGAPMYLPVDQIVSDLTQNSGTAKSQTPTPEIVAVQPFKTEVQVESQVDPAPVQQQEPQQAVQQVAPAALVNNSNQPAVNTTNEDLNRAYDFILKKDTASAMPILNKIIETDPKNDLAFEYRGWCFNYNKNYDEAIKDYFKVVELNPEEGKKALKNIAFIYWDKENYPQSTANFYEYLKSFPDDGEAYYFMAFSRLYQNHFEQSLRDLESAEKLGQKDTDGLRQKIAAARAAEEQEFSGERKATYDKAVKERDEAMQEIFARSGKDQKETKGGFPFGILINIGITLIIAAVIITMRSRGKKVPPAGQRTQPNVQQGLSSEPLTLQGIFERDHFYFSRRLSITERYYVFDESGQRILFVERPIIARNFLASFVGIIVAIILFIVGFLGITPVLSPGLNSIGGLLLGALIAGVLAVIGAGAVISGMEKKRRVVIYRDETKQEKILEIVQDSKFVVIKTVYSLLGPKDNLLAKFRRNHFIDNFRRKLYCLRPDGSLWFCAREDSPWLAFLRRIIPLDSFLIVTNYDILEANTNRKLGEFNRTSALLDKHVLDISTDKAKYIERKVALACAVLLDVKI